MEPYVVSIIVFCVFFVFFVIMTIISIIYRYRMMKKFGQTVIMTQGGTIAQPGQIAQIATPPAYNDVFDRTPQFVVVQQPLQAPQPNALSTTTSTQMPIQPPPYSTCSGKY